MSDLAGVEEAAPSAQLSEPVECRDGHGVLYCYPAGDGRGRLSRDFGAYGAIWATNTEEVGIFPGPDGVFTACPGLSAATIRTFKTLRGATGYMHRTGLDAYGRDLPRPAVAHLRGVR